MTSLTRLVDNKNSLCQSILVGERMFRRTATSRLACRCKANMLLSQMHDPGCQNVKGGTLSDSHPRDTTQLDSCFEIKPTFVRFGLGAISELGRECRRLGMLRVVAFTDSHLADTEFVSQAVRVMAASGVDVILSREEVSVEPTDVSFTRCGNFLRDTKANGVVSIGGGSVMDSAKAATVWAACPRQEDILDYVTAPAGKGLAPSGLLVPHIACPTTCGTGSECTPIAICDILRLHRKSGIVHKALTPTMAIVDPAACFSLPSSVLAASGFDVLSHAIESYTARPYSARPQIIPADLTVPIPRPSLQGRNPYTDVGCITALEYVGRSYTRAVADPTDKRAVEEMVFASCLAGTAMGSAGCHLPHGMSYPVSGAVPTSYSPPFPYPGGSGSPTYRTDVGTPPVLPHGFSVALHTPAVMRMLQEQGNEETTRRLQHVYDALSRYSSGRQDLPRVPDHSVGEAVAELLIGFLKVNKMPRGLLDIGFERNDADRLAQKCLLERRLLSNAPFEVSEQHLVNMYAGAMSYW